MKLVRFAQRQVSRAVFWVLLPYLIYLVFYGCATGAYSPNVISEHTCPPLQSAVYPVWFAHVYPRVLWVDKKLHVSSTISAKLSPVKETWRSFDAKYEVSDVVQEVYMATSWTVRTIYGTISQHLGPHFKFLGAKSSEIFRANLHPLFLHYGAQYKHALESTVDSCCDHTRLLFWRVSGNVKTAVCELYSSHVAPVFARSGAFLSQYPFYQKVTAVGRSVFSLLLEKSSRVSSSLQQKKDFVRAEFNNLVGVSSLRSKFIRDRKEMSTVVSHILEEITESDLPAQVTEFLQEEHNGEEFSDYSDDDEAPLTFTMTQTIYVTADDEEEKADPTSSNVESIASETSFDSLQTGSEEDELMPFGSDSSQAQIDYELAFWQSKVQKTLDLAYQNLMNDFGPFLASKTEDLKQAISANFSTLQQENYQRYKEMNELIVAIHKDAEFIRETNTTIPEPKIDRQLMRDKIAAAYAIPEEMMRFVETGLNEAHVSVMTQYFKVAQDTVDVLESFADTAISDFSSRLSALLDVLQYNDDFDDTMSWSAWKSFHKVKESIFEIRDQIFDEANAYKFNARESKVPQGLEPWADYLGKVNFHLTFLMRDNAEYLQLVRAKANVAYQEREGLTYHLEQREEAARREKEFKQEEEIKLKEEKQREEEKQTEEEKEKQADDWRAVQEEELKADEEHDENLSIAEKKEQIVLQMDSGAEEAQHEKLFQEAKIESGTRAQNNNEEPDQIEDVSETQVPTTKPSDENSADLLESVLSHEVKTSSTGSEETNSQDTPTDLSTVETKESISKPTPATTSEETSLMSDSSIPTEHSDPASSELSSIVIDTERSHKASLEPENFDSDSLKEADFLVSEIEDVHVPEASEQDELVQEADEGREMNGEREPVHDEL